MWGDMSKRKVLYDRDKNRHGRKQEGNIQSEMQVILGQRRSIECERVFKISGAQFHAGTVVEEFKDCR